MRQIQNDELPQLKLCTIILMIVLATAFDEGAVRGG